MENVLPFCFLFVTTLTIPFRITSPSFVLPRLYVNTDNADERESLCEKALQSYSVLSVAASLPEEKEEDNSRDDHLSHGEEKEDRLQSSAQRL